MKKHDTFLFLYCMSYIVIYMTLSLVFGALIFTWDALQTVIFFLVFQSLLIGIAYEINEILFSLFTKPRKLLRQTLHQNTPAVAVLMTTCDDVHPAGFVPLGKQTYPNYDVFILDDSEDPGQQILVDQCGYQVVRRPIKNGFKAGNLNYWLRRYGSNYKYFIVLDSDSVVDRDFVAKMVSYAEHPTNQSIAIFQSKINNWNTNNLWSRLLGLIAPVRMYILERVNNHMETIFSFGHNHLVRTQTIQEIGGIPEFISAEDTALTLLLGSRGYSVVLVDVISHDSEPGSFQLYVRRTTRWAKQTVEVFRQPWFGAPLRLKISLCFTLYFYIRPFTLFILLIMSSLALVGVLSNDQSTIIAYAPMVNWRMSNTLFVIMVGLWVFQQVLYASLVYKTKVSMRSYILSSILSISLAHTLAIPILNAMARTLMGKPVHFIPTNSPVREMKHTRIFVSNYLPACLLLGGLYGYGIFKTSFVSLLWAVLITASFLLLWFAEKQHPQFRVFKRIQHILKQF